MKVISPKVHGIIDYLVVIFLILAPNLFGLPELTTTITYVIAGIHFTLTILTRYQPGIIKVIPLGVHGWIELIVSIALVGLAFYLQNIEGDLSRNFYLGFGVAVFLTWLLTDYGMPNKEVA
jgi:hypothetical protein